MKYNKILKGLFVATTFSIFSFGYSDDKAQGNVNWGYIGSKAPEYWGELSPEYKRCQDGKYQSPINIVTTNTIKGTEANKIKIDYHLHAESVINYGYTIQIQFKPGSYIYVGKEKYELKQVHFHAPGEDYIDGENFPFVADFVNVSEDGKTVVLELLYKYNEKGDQFIKEMWKHIPAKVDATNKIDFVVNKDSNPIPKGHHSFYVFKGSLTVPPCKEGVKWVVFKDQAYISKEQVKTFTDILKFDNNRPLQKLNNRKIMLEE